MSDAAIDALTFAFLVYHQPHAGVHLYDGAGWEDKDCFCCVACAHRSWLPITEWAQGWHLRASTRSGSCSKCKRPTEAVCPTPSTS